jgi:protein TonB
VSLPRVIHEVKAEYPPAALKAKIEGAVFLSAVAEVDGSAGRIAIVRSLDAEYGIDQAAMDALAQWRFEPGQKDGQAVPVEIEIEMRFRLK